MEYKGYELKSDKTFGLIYIKKIGKGSAPKHLRGGYTSETLAMRDIDKWSAVKEEKANGTDGTD